MFKDDQRRGGLSEMGLLYPRLLCTHHTHACQQGSQWPLASAAAVCLPGRLPARSRSQNACGMEVRLLGRTKSCPRRRRGGRRAGDRPDGSLPAVQQGATSPQWLLAVLVHNAQEGNLIWSVTFDKGTGRGRARAMTRLRVKTRDPGQVLEVLTGSSSDRAEK